MSLQNNLALTAAITAGVATEIAVIGVPTILGGIASVYGSSILADLKFSAISTVLVGAAVGFSVSTSNETSNIVTSTALGALASATLCPSIIESSYFRDYVDLDLKSLVNLTFYIGAGIGLCNSVELTGTTTAWSVGESVYNYLSVPESEI